MKAFASKEKQSVTAGRKALPYVHYPMGPVQLAQRAEIRHILRSTCTQAKLTVGAPNDKYEQEADRVADQVMRMPDPKLQRQPENEAEEETLQAKPLAGQITPLIQRQAEPDEEEELIQPGYDQEPEESNPIMESVPTRDASELGGAEEELIQTKPLADKPEPVTAELHSKIQSLKGGGQTLPASERAFFEPRFGADFSNVRVHNDNRAGLIARSINARAYTHGRDVVFGSAQYAPGTSEGRRLMAHELTHVVQHDGGGHVRQKRVLNPLPLLAKKKYNTPVINWVSPSIIQRQPVPPAQQDWQAYVRIRNHYGNLTAYRIIRNRVVGWNNPNIANVGRFINTALGEWNGNRRVRRHFNGGFDGRQSACYLNIKRLFRHRGIPNPANYIVNNIAGIRFFNIRTSGHRALRTALNRAQASLSATGVNYVLVPSGGFVPRTVRGTVNTLSNHALGRAIDFDAPRNPLLTNRAFFRVIDKVIQPLFGQGLLALRNPAVLRLASIYFQNNYNAWQARQGPQLRRFRRQRQRVGQFIRRTRRNIRQTNRQIARLRRQLRRASAQQQRLQTAIGQQQTTLWMLQRVLSAARFFFRVIRTAARKQRQLVRMINRNRAALAQLARRGFMNLPMFLVFALQQAGLNWGGTWRTRKDFMHFQIP